MSKTMLAISFGLMVMVGCASTTSNTPTTEVAPSRQTATGNAPSGTAGTGTTSTTGVSNGASSSGAAGGPGH